MQGYEERSDKALLEAFIEHRDEAAFAAIVRRHEKLVANVAFRVLDDRQDARDVAQAVFLTLALKARRLDRDRPVAPWLHRIASRLAWAARREREARRRRERTAMDRQRDDSHERRTFDELRPVLDGELDRLPERYRRPIILFHLEGKSLEETAAALESGVGTVGSWLSRGRDLLKDRLVRRGVSALSVGALAAFLSEAASAHEVSLGFARSTVSAACAMVAGRAGSLVSGHVVRLTEGALHMMSTARIKAAIVPACLAAGILVSMAWFFSGEGPDSSAPAPFAVQAAEPPPAPAQESAPQETVVQEEEKKSTLGNGLVGHWKLDEGTSSTEASDASGKGHAGSLAGAVAWGNGKVIGALRLDGKGGYVALPNSDPLRRLQEGSFTLAAWFRADQTPPGTESDNDACYAIVVKSGWHLGLTYSNESKFKMDYWLQGSADEEPVWAGTGSWETSDEPGVWHHVVGVVDRAAGETRIYVNGEYRNGDGWDSTVPVRPYHDQTWKIGIGGPGYEEWSWQAKGSIDDVRFYDRALSAAEIKELHEAASKEE